MKVKKKSQIQEKRVAKDLNAKTVVASGALWGSKGDVRHPDLLVECKTTSKPYYSLDITTTWYKIEKEAIRDGIRLPVMCIEINDGADRFAVFKGDHFNHYEQYDELIDGDLDTVYSQGKSFRVYEPCRVLMLGLENSVTHKVPCFTVAPWDKFVEMINKGSD